MADYSYSQAPLGDEEDDYSNYPNQHQHQHLQDGQDDEHMAIDMASRDTNNQPSNHFPQLSESFYHEAANALNSNSDPFSSSTNPSHNSNNQSTMAAHLPTLLGNDPYGGDGNRDGMLNTIPEYASGISGAETGNGAYEEKDSGYRGGGDYNQNNYSTRSSEEDDYRKGNDPFLGPQVDYIPSPYNQASRSDEEGTLDGAKEAGAYDYQNANYDDGYYQQPYGEGGDADGYPHGRSTSFNSTYTGAPGMMNAGLETQHFGPAPARGAQLRRHKTKKNVKLTQGNLVLDCPVPTKLQTFLSRKGEEEFTTMR